MTTPEPTPEGGVQHLALLGSFDEISVGGNWTNSSVIRYLGPTIGQDRTTSIPQVVLLAREVSQLGDTVLQVGPEHEIGRFIGIGAIESWVARGAILPR